MLIARKACGHDSDQSRAPADAPRRLSPELLRQSGFQARLSRLSGSSVRNFDRKHRRLQKLQENAGVVQCENLGLVWAAQCTLVVHRTEDFNERFCRPSEVHTKLCFGLF
ncbi:hypothetical protein GGX14DRAFT_408998 [Mycena pura]|uniref:Uncharacterized protein n=1 Tax=Mycena pura TaxID=153505 RepID=A0AAD6UPG8_9AGAR|nr:hypothetical protein GGX14DRAFT_408998 [Mycena pura]